MDCVDEARGYFPCSVPLEFAQISTKGKQRMNVGLSVFSLHDGTLRRVLEENNSCSFIVLMRFTQVRRIFLTPPRIWCSIVRIKQGRGYLQTVIKLMQNMELSFSKEIKQK